MEYLVLMNSVLKRTFLDMNAKERERFREKLSYLESGIWDSGLKVKKLKGMSKKVIFEARVDKGDRLIFTIGRQGEQSVIYLWGLSTHDDVDRQARSVMPANAPFLNFSENVEEEHSELYFDELAGDYFSQEGLEERAYDDYGPQKWHRLDETLWERLDYRTEGSSDDFELLLFLTEMQDEILATAPPILLSGTAGSGKTTIAVYYLLKESLLDKKRIFITYNSYLKRFAHKSYLGLIKDSPLESEGSHPDFYVFKELLLELVEKGRDSERFRPENEVDFKVFDRIYHNHKLCRKYDAELVWQEIRSIIKGAKPQISLFKFKTLYNRLMKGDLSTADCGRFREYLLELSSFSFFPKLEKLVAKKSGYSDYANFVLNLEAELAAPSPALISILKEIYKQVDKRANDFSTPLLTFDEYNMLGKKRAPAFYYDREELYEIACFYQKHLEEGGLWDEIDLCKAAILRLETTPELLNYDFVICDEIQDFTDIQLYFLLKVTNNLKSVLFAGDPKQIINPSSFRWEEVREKFYERGVAVPDVYHMRLNFRSVGSIVRLGNSLLDLKQKLIGLSSSELKEEWKFNGSPPIVIDGIEEQELYKELSGIGAGQIILVRDREEKAILKSRIGSEMIFTINEAKGLEFDTVLVWKFLKEKRYSDIWRRINSGSELERSSHPHIRHEINLLYVAITRARNTILFYDGEHSSEIWKINMLREHIFHSNDRALLASAWSRISSPLEWEKQGDYFLERDYFPAAFECYKNSGNNSKLIMAEAYLLEEKGSYTKAAERFLQAGYEERAARNFQRGEAYEEAYKLWKRLGNEQEMARSLVHLYEQKGDYNSAAREWLKLGKRERAIKNWTKSRNWQALGSLLLEEDDYTGAAAYFERSKNYRKAADCYMKSSDRGRAASLYFKSGAYAEALPLFEELNNRNMQISCHRELGNNYALFELYNEAGKAEDAIHHLTLYMEESAESSERVQELHEQVDAERVELADGIDQLDETNIDEAVQNEVSLEVYQILLKLAIVKAALGRSVEAGEIFAKFKQYELALKLFTKEKALEQMLACYEKLNMFYEYVKLKEEMTFSREVSEASLLELSQHINNQVEQAYKQGNESFLNRLSKEAEKLHKDGELIKAHIRYNSLQEFNKLLDVLLDMDNDNIAVGHYVHTPQDLTFLNYLAEVDSLNMTEEVAYALNNFIHTFFVKMNQQDSMYPHLYRLLDIYKDMLEKDDDAEQVRTMLEDLFQKLCDQPFRKDIYLAPHFAIIYRVRWYNMLFRMLQYYYEEGADKKELKLVEEIKESAEREGDGYLKAIYLYTRPELDSDELYNILAPLEIGENSHLLFSHSKGNYRRAVNYYLEQDRVNEAIECCKSQNELKQAVDILLKYERYKEAGDQLLNLKEYNRALDCFKKANRADMIAKTYETMGEFRKAVKLWDEIGRHKQADRVRRKISMSGIKFEDE